MAEKKEKGRLGWSIASLVIGLGVTALVVYILRVAPETEGHVGSASRIHRVPVGDAPSKGPDDALVTIVEFSDFQCPHCQAAAVTVGRLVDEAEDVRLAFRQSPLTLAHPQAMGAAVASLAAHEQGRFWEFHDALFAGQPELSARGPAFFGDIARRLGLDLVRFEGALDGPRLQHEVRADRRLLLRLGQGAVPTFFVNGRALRGNLPIDRFRSAIDEARANALDTLDRGVPREELYRALIADGVGPELPDAGLARAPIVSPPASLGEDDGPTCGADVVDAGCD